MGATEKTHKTEPTRQLTKPEKTRLSGEIETREQTASKSLQLRDL